MKTADAPLTEKVEDEEQCVICGKMHESADCPEITLDRTPRLVDAAITAERERIIKRVEELLEPYITDLDGQLFASGARTALKAVLAIINQEEKP